MASSSELFAYILDRLSLLPGIKWRRMMGEYIVYFNEKIAACLCGDRLLVKPVPAAESLLPGAVRLASLSGRKGNAAGGKRG